ncbi:hypothetical protein [Paenibacillus riograndensis]|uniref:hypothetical protein n=1 Tax=Paenibacillus riograndensis TaxID=483937 RepID=UPI000764B1CD|nr:hypothetical protein [Paenibacillus riograndensis]
MDAGRMNNMLTMEERTMVRDLILLPYIDTMASNSMREMELSRNILAKAYLMAGKYIQKRIMQDTYRLRQALKKQNIKVEEDTNDDFILYYMIYYRGYQERFGMTRDVMRTEISLRLTQYTSDYGNVLKDYLK